MGFLEIGEPFSWADSREVIAYIREHGIEVPRRGSNPLRVTHPAIQSLTSRVSDGQQFIAMYDKVKTIDNDELKWGDEIEYGILVHDAASGTVKCSLRGAEILAELQRKEQQSPSSDSNKSTDRGCQWVPEYGSWMVEATPDTPYSNYATDLVAVERNMRLRRARLLSVLRPDEICPTVACFPLLGVGDFTVPAATCAAPGREMTRAPAFPPRPKRGRAALTDMLHPSLLRCAPIASQAQWAHRPVALHPRRRHQPAPALRRAHGQHPRAPRQRRRHPHAQICRHAHAGAAAAGGRAGARERGRCRRDGGGVHGRDGLWHGLLLPAGHLPGARSR